VTGDPLTVAVNDEGAPTSTLTSPVAGMVCCWPAAKTPLNTLAPVGPVTLIQHSLEVAETTSVKLLDATA